MKRRSLIAGLGSLGTASAFVLGSGAFTTVQAERSVYIETASDMEALLRLESVSGGGRASNQDLGEQLRFDIPGAFENNFNPSNPEGLGTDSVYRIGRDAASSEPGLFAVQNQGTQDIRVWGSQPSTTTENGDKLPDVDIYDVDTGNILKEDDRSEVLSPGGSSLLAGLRIDTHGVEIRDTPYEFEITIHAEAVE